MGEKSLLRTYYKVVCDIFDKSTRYSLLQIAPAGKYVSSINGLEAPPSGRIPALFNKGDNVCTSRLLFCTPSKPLVKMCLLQKLRIAERGTDCYGM